MFKYILFDFDGTLVDTNELITFCLQETSMKYLNRNLSDDDITSIWGKLLVDQVKYMSETSYERMILYYKELYRSNHDNMVRLFPGVQNTLSDLKEANFKIAIVSSKGRNGIERGLKHFNLEKYFDTIISAYDVENSKPCPEPALKAIEALRGDKDSSLLVGDSPHDILCGKNAGIKTAAVSWSIFSRQNILKLKPDFYIENLEKLIEIVKCM